jgi:predicted Fe-Mo cluster-binding NifX family protein
MKKIAVPVEGENVSAHFGHAPAFAIFAVEANKIVDQEEMVNPGHEPGLLPRLLKEAGSDVIIASGMGQKAISIFNQNEIEVVCGASGKAVSAVEAYLKDDLKTDANSCSHPEDDDHEHHQGDHDCQHANTH